MQLSMLINCLKMHPPLEFCRKDIVYLWAVLVSSANFVLSAVCLLLASTQIPQIPRINGLYFTWSRLGIGYWNIGHHFAKWPNICTHHYITGRPWNTHTLICFTYMYMYPNLIHIRYYILLHTFSIHICELSMPLKMLRKSNTIRYETMIYNFHFIFSNVLEVCYKFGFAKL